MPPLANSRDRPLFCLFDWNKEASSLPGIRLRLFELAKFSISRLGQSAALRYGIHPGWHCRSAYCAAAAKTKSDLVRRFEVFADVLKKQAETCFDLDEFIDPELLNFVLEIKD
ncbi:hypothetical protein J8I29_06985 [Labrys sp. LIt4]|uniref:hypothetical protein n=1 Tax=Labrys TaxID=204476 RepID=UPI0015E42587|nr:MULTISPECIES: hypothetical protein [Labrys]MBP0579043.1 hypothetical protein [Labrys sp. LIt4]